MSTKKDVLKPTASSRTKTKPKTGATKASSNRDKSTDRNHIKKEETQVTKSKSLSNGKIKPATNNNLKVLKPKKAAPSDNETVIKTKPTTKPSSSRITKTQYFPSKSLYSQALHGADVSAKDQSSRTSTVNKKPSTTAIKSVSNSVVKKKTINKTEKEVNPVTGRRALPKKTKDKEIEKNEISSEASSMSDRPRTATLRKGSIVNNNIVGPDVPKPLKINVLKQKDGVLKEVSSKQETEDTYNYEDDFESYESDFEACSSSSSSESTINMDLPELSSDSSSSSRGDKDSNSDNSIQEPLTTNHKRTNSAGTDDERKLDSGNFDLTEFKHKHLLDNIKESIEKENTNFKNNHVEQNKSNLASLSDEGFEDGKSLQLINFVDAQKKYQHRKCIEKRRKRSDAIMSMIRLDSVSYTIYESPPVPYDIFIKKYGKINTVQTTIQTGDDDVCEETQTDVPNYINKWTQFPVVFNKIDLSDENFWNNYKSDYLGVGNDIIDSNKSSTKITNLNENYLEKFILSAGKLVFKVLNESKSDFKMEKLKSTEMDHAFSKGFLSFNTDSEFFRYSKVMFVSICTHNPDIILTVHSTSGEADTNSSLKSVVCVWNICNLSEPQYWLACYGDLSCSCFGLQPDIVFGGLKDGSVVIWNTAESSTIHNNLQNFVDYNILFRTETFRTEINTGHNTKVVAIQQLYNSNHRINSTTNEICSLEEIGDIIIWSVVTKNYNNKETVLENQGLAHWGATMIMKTALISLRELYPNLIELQCTDLTINSMDSKYMFVSTNYGYILQCSINTSKSNLKQFTPESNSSANCLDICPFSPLYFVSGNDDGKLNLYSRLKETPIMVLSNKENEDESANMEMVLWSHNKPFIIYTKDQNNIIHIWDLKTSELSPIRSMPYKENISSMKLSPKYENKKAFMVIATSEGSIQLHLLNEDHTWSSENEHENNVTEFLHYFNSL